MSASDTPMFQQYLGLKATVGDALLLYRMGDFYELFFADAVIAAETLDLTLTTRNKNDDDPIPMAGVPYHSVSPYIEKLVAAGYRVALAEQTEAASASRGLVARAITRFVTPGVPWDPTALEGGVFHWLVAVCAGPEGLGLAFLDVSTGDLRLEEASDADDAAAALWRMEPREALTGPGRLGQVVERALKAIPKAPADPIGWDPEEGAATLKAAGLVLGGGVAARAAGAVLRYGAEMLRKPVPIRRVDRSGAGAHLVLDESTRQNLELTRSLRGGGRQGSLLGLLDRTRTSPGARRLRDWLLAPLIDVEAIRSRQDSVEALVVDAAVREDLRTALKDVADVDRIAMRTSQGTSTPRDLAGLRRSLETYAVLASAVGTVPVLCALLPADGCEDVLADLRTWLVEEPPLSLVDGGVIARGADPVLDDLVNLATEGVGDLSSLEDRLQRATGIHSLKVRRNRVFGFYIEVTNANVDRVPAAWTRRQTVASGERYVTSELKELEEKVLSADDRRKALERAHFDRLADRVAVQGPRLAKFASAIATLDALGALAEVASRRRWVRPVVDGSEGLELSGSRHPVVEAFLEEGTFVPNDIVLDTCSRQLVLLTGPNMAGKSTVLRQVALTAVLAQMGSWVPAAVARVGVCDRVFTRVGASDDLVRGQSTFMVEMSETASILGQATSRSLVVLDEIGRGTSTWDGLSIAWAVAEDLANRVRCRALFATHYHELSALADQIPGVVNAHVSVTESAGEIVFTHRLRPGGASRSYGIQCARLAGLPGPVVARASALLARFERTAPRDERNQLSLFGVVPDLSPEPEPPPLHAALLALQGLDPDSLTPREALAALYRLRSLCLA